LADDVITLKARVVYVLGVGDVMLSPQHPREPFHPDYSTAWQRTVRDMARDLDIREARAEQKWCSCCDTWRHVSLFSRDERYRDGLRPHCKPCRADHERHLYALQKAQQGGEAVRPYRKRAA